MKESHRIIGQNMCCSRKTFMLKWTTAPRIFYNSVSHQLNCRRLGTQWNWTNSQLTIDIRTNSSSTSTIKQAWEQSATSHHCRPWVCVIINFLLHTFWHNQRIMVYIFWLQANRQPMIIVVVVDDDDDYSGIIIKNESEKEVFIVSN